MQKYLFPTIIVLLLIAMIAAGGAAFYFFLYEDTAEVLSPEEFSLQDYNLRSTNEAFDEQNNCYQANSALLDDTIPQECCDGISFVEETEQEGVFGYCIDESTKKP